MPTTVTKSIGSAGGRDYASITSWEAQNLDLVTLDQLQTALLYNDSVFVEYVTIAGWTVDATRYIKVQAADATQEHALVRGSGVLVSPADASVSITVITSSMAYTVHEGYSIGDFTLTNSGATSVSAKGLSPDGISNNLKRMMFYAIHNVHSSTGNGHVLGVNPITSSMPTIENCVAFDLVNSGGGSGIGIVTAFATQRNAGSGSFGAIRNCTAFTCVGTQVANAIMFVGTSAQIENNLCFGTTAVCFSVGTSSTANNNTSSDATAPGTNAVINATASDYFADVGSGTEDPTLKAGSPAIDTGADLSALFTTDAKGTTRPQGAAWDRGAHEASTGHPAIRRFGGCQFVRDIPIGVEGIRVY